MSLYLLHYLYSYLPIHQNPFLCLFVDIYNLASQDDNLKSERFVTSIILNGKGEEVMNVSCGQESGRLHNDTINLNTKGEKEIIPTSFFFLPYI